MESGKVVLITGSAKGLGKRTALTLAAQGFDIALNYLHSSEEAKQLEVEIARLGARCVSIQGDITRPADIQRLVEEVSAKLGGIDVLVNNAGPFIRERKLFADYSIEEIRYLLSGNLTSVIELDHLVLPYMRKREWGRIIHFGFGRAAESPAWVHRAVYAAAKTGLVSFTKSLAAEEAPRGITVNMICPGDSRGENKEKSIEVVELLRDDESPRGRPGSGEVIARVIGFLCLPHSDFLTGNIIDVSGGMEAIRSLSGSRLK